MRHFDRDFALTNRLRTDGTDHLLSAGQAVGVRRFVAQGVAGYAAYERTGGPVKSEEDPLDTTPAREMRETLAAIRHLEEAVLGAEWTEGIVLRYGAFYGPGHIDGAGRGAVRAGPQAQVPAGRRRWRRVVLHPRRRRGRGDGGGDRARRAVVSTTWSTMIPLRSPSGCRRWLRSSAPRSRCACPRFIGRLFAGETGVVMMTEVRGASNAKAKRELAWRPAHPSWRQGFAAA